MLAGKYLLGNKQIIKHLRLIILISTKIQLKFQV